MFDIARRSLSAQPLLPAEYQIPKSYKPLNILQGLAEESDSVIAHQIINMFGSLEEFERVSDDYVLEEYRTETYLDNDLDFNQMKIMVEVKYKLRLKTKEERDNV